MKTLLLNYNTDSNSINKASTLLKNGYIGIFPTDTVYGIGCDALNITAINNLFKFKKRQFNKPINILIANKEIVKNFTPSINWIEEKLIENFWPGALTIVFDKSDIVPNILTSGLTTVGIRMPNNKLCLDLINNFGSAIATSSANIANNPPCNNIEDILKDFSDKVSFILDSNEKISTFPSTIVRVENNEIIILRKGSISKHDIEKCFGGNINVK